MTSMEELKEIVASLAISQKKTDEHLNKIAEDIKELREAQKKTDEQLKKTDEQLKKTDEQLKKTDEQMIKTDKKLKSIGIQLGNITKNIGDIAEEYFVNSLQDKMEILGIKFDVLDMNLHRIKGKLEGEYDIILINGKNIAIIEVKYKLHRNDIEKLDKKMKIFKELFPEYAHLNLYGGFATFKVYEDVKEIVQKKGYFLLQRKGNIVETYANNVKIS